MRKKRIFKVFIIVLKYKYKNICNLRRKLEKVASHCIYIIGTDVIELYKCISKYR